MAQAEKEYVALVRGIQENGGVGMSKALCAECPVNLLCLEYALESNEDEGIWGGLTNSERKAIRRRRAA